LWIKNQGKLIPWNFSKFLLNKDGEVVLQIDQKPFPLEFRNAIENELGVNMVTQKDKISLKDCEIK